VQWQIASMLTSYSGGPVADFHGLPFILFMIQRQVVMRALTWFDYKMALNFSKALFQKRVFAD